MPTASSLRIPIDTAVTAITTNTIIASTRVLTERTTRKLNFFITRFFTRDSKAIMSDKAPKPMMKPAIIISGKL